VKHVVLIAIAAISSATLAFPAFAQGTAQQRAACEGDAFKFCAADIPSAEKIEACLRAKLSEISPACRAEFEKVERK